MLSRDQFNRVEGGYDQFGRTLGGGHLADTGNINPLGRAVQLERAGRIAADQLQTDLDACARAKRSAKTSEIAKASDQAWCNLKAAQCHILLVEKFLRESSDYRLEANRLAATPGGMMRAEQARVMATRLATMAERHRRAAQKRQEMGQQEAAEVEQMVARAAAAGNPGHGNPGHGNPGHGNPQPTRPRTIIRRADPPPPSPAPPEPPPNPEAPS